MAREKTADVRDSTDGEDRPAPAADSRPGNFEPGGTLLGTGYAGSARRYNLWDGTVAYDAGHEPER